MLKITCGASSIHMNYMWTSSMWLISSVFLEIRYVCHQFLSGLHSLKTECMNECPNFIYIHIVDHAPTI